MSLENEAGRAVPDIEQAAEHIEQTPGDGSSDGEGGERTARERLKKTSIAGLVQSSEARAGTTNESVNAESVPATHREDTSRGRPSKKRSFEDLQTEDARAGLENGGPPVPKKGLHKRMRSREVSGSDDVAEIEKLEDIASPVREETDAEAKQSPSGPGVLVDATEKGDEPKTTETDAQDVTAKPETGAVDAAAEKPKNSSSTEKPQPQAKIPPSSAFANTSTASPFSNVKSPSKETATVSSPEKSTSTSAFASSGLSAFASSEKSPFGAVGSTAKVSGGFGGSAGPSGFGSSSSGFGSASPFATKPASGFGSGGVFGGVFGVAKPFGSSGLSSFAGPAGSASSFGKAKPIGTANNDDEEGSDNGEDNDEKPETEEDVQQDPRFKQQERLETGEEDEQTIFQCRAKLYHFDKEWKERGAGVFKINIRYESKTIGEDAEGEAEKTAGEEEEEEEDDVEAGGQPEFSTVERKARLIMRTDGVHKVVLNTPVFKNMKVGTGDGKEPNGKTMLIAGLDEGKPSLFQIKVGKEDAVREMYHKIRELQEDL
ncbi:hypothetical protein HRR83_006203 [Exophiala dermatitidis]|uniref:RanBD1 domain-containing protein n=2 Tax=Exophiala dermatitidis TaxID=5970 RepID=H6BM28_EXODN|nr:uncharacterized protein HMPREF1120_01165 [Exophiala dermatitidis NIH/UT8656]KAJ4504935.1 hypothetical protein HRR73_008689 [Exophiala dermatitidis]EHY52964.1 hypothetical protein HMPREF1120_01165 [Exophiala dermatitidis NIH/UT8656]KAJ4512230.1 hypothetical protein HRR75_005130 [Exophiala dermatitidis]KAJ4515135.1 hypothetical protein HRR74_005600 [Exophiala dermatitidis]KAJ4548613.1 hypothetical protein HRR76_001204 [Exophiala dermatitidis]